MDKFADPEHPNKDAARLRLLGLRSLSAEQRARASCVMLQIDGLSYRHFRRALVTGKLPFLTRLLRRRQASAGPWHAMLPTSTSAFQAGLFYGNNDDIPGFFWFDKKRGRKVRMNGSEDTARVEERLQQCVAPDRGLMAGGSSYAALFSGGADNTFMTFARLFSPRYNLTARRGWLMIFLLSQFQLVARIFYYSAVELVLACYDLVVGLFTKKKLYLELKFLFPRIFSVVVCREIATLAAILDIYRGVGPIYLNYLAYDEHAHHRGPDSRFAFWTLRGIDASIKRVWQAAEKASRLGIRHFDVFVWSDHGQTPVVPFEDLIHDLPERHFDVLFRLLYGPNVKPRPATVGGAKGKDHAPLKPRLEPQYLERQARRNDFLTAISPRWLGKMLDNLMRPALEADSQLEWQLAADTGRRIQFVSTGPVGHLCLNDGAAPLAWEDWLERYPKFLDLIAQHQGVGFALARTRAGGCRVGYQGRWLDLASSNEIKEHCPIYIAQILLSRRADFTRWATMPAAGDLILFGQRDAGEPVITYTYEHGAHGGPSPQETLPFMLLPAEIASNWPEIAPERSGGNNLLTLDQLHRRLRRAYNPLQVIELEPMINLDPDEAPESYERPA